MRRGSFEQQSIKNNGKSMANFIFTRDNENLELSIGKDDENSNSYWKMSNLQYALEINY
jgi:hypothetical protein